jgi:hypothetical protein
MHLPSLSQVLIYACGYVTGASVLCNVLPKDTVFDAYPRVKTAYGTVVLILASSAFNLRKFTPAANLKIPFLGFGDYEKQHPELFGAVLVSPGVGASPEAAIKDAAANAAQTGGNSPRS